MENWTRENHVETLTETTCFSRSCFGSFWFLADYSTWIIFRKLWFDKRRQRCGVILLGDTSVSDSAVISWSGKCWRYSRPRWIIARQFALQPSGRASGDPTLSSPDSLIKCNSSSPLAGNTTAFESIWGIWKYMLNGLPRSDLCDRHDLHFRFRGTGNYSLLYLSSRGDQPSLYKVLYLQVNTRYFVTPVLMPSKWHKDGA